MGCVRGWCAVNGVECCRRDAPVMHGCASHPSDGPRDSSYFTRVHSPVWIVPRCLHASPLPDDVSVSVPLLTDHE